MNFNKFGWIWSLPKTPRKAGGLPPPTFVDSLVSAFFNTLGVFGKHQIHQYLTVTHGEVQLATFGFGKI